MLRGREPGKRTVSCVRCLVWDPMECLHEDVQWCLAVRSKVSKDKSVVGGVVQFMKRGGQPKQL